MKELNLINDVKDIDSVFFDNLIYKINIVINSINYTDAEKVEAINWLIKQSDKPKVIDNEN
jgi:hypothetical protein